MSVAQRFKDIADAIREKTGGTDVITPLQMPSEIRNIQSGVETLTEAEWEALSTEEKQALGIVGIIYKDSGFIRGVMVSGSDYVPSIKYLYDDGVQVVAWETDYFIFSSDNVHADLTNYRTTAQYLRTINAIDISLYNKIVLSYTLNDDTTSIEFNITTYNDAYKILIQYTYGSYYSISWLQLLNAEDTAVATFEIGLSYSGISTLKFYEIKLTIDES